MVADIASARPRPARQVSGISSPVLGNAKYGAFSYRRGRGPGRPSPRDLPNPPRPSNPLPAGGDLRALQARGSIGRRTLLVQIVIREAPRPRLEDYRVKRAQSLR
jgi:hypothetical protein